MRLPASFRTASLALAFALPGPAGAEAPTGGASVVMELFTSQGCSSCPPADALLGELAQRPNVVALAFHVDYWDDIGWRDRFSMPQATARQHDYIGALGMSSAFTPQLVIDGRRSVVGSDRSRILAALTENAPLKVAIQAAVSESDVVISLPQDAVVRSPYVVYIAAYIAQATTAVGRGENSGRRLTEFNIVREFRQVETWSGSPSTVRVPRGSFPSDATDLAVLVQQPNAGRIAGAAVVHLANAATNRPP